MFLFFLFTISLSSCFVNIIGAIPSDILSSLHLSSAEIQKTSNKNLQNSDIYIFESSKLLNQPENTEQICTIKAKIPKFYVFKRDFDVSLEQSFYIPKDISGSLEIYNFLVDNNFSICFDEKLANYIISQENNTKEGFSIAEDSFLRDMNEININYYVFSSLGSLKLAHEICKKQINYDLFLLYLIMLFSLIVVSISIQNYYIRHANFDFHENTYFWIYDQNFQKIYGMPLEKLDKNSRKFMKQSLLQAYNTKNSASSIIFLRREEFNHVFRRSGVFPLKFGIHRCYIAIIWEEKLPEEPEELSFEYEIKSNEHVFLEKPRLSFSSFRDLCPIHFTFTLDNNVRGFADLPSSILAPFQPNGQLVTVILSIFYDLVRILTTNPFIQTNFRVFSELCFKKVNASMAFCFLNSNKLIMEYYNDIPPLSQEEIHNLPKKINLDHGFIFLNDFITKGKKCFINRVINSNIDMLTIIELENVKWNIFFQTYGLPFFNYCCIFMYQLSLTKELNLQYERIIKILTEIEPGYTFCEISYPSERKLIISQKDKNDIQRLFVENPNKYDNDINGIINSGNSVYQKVVRFDLGNDDKQKFISYSGNCFNDPETHEKILTMVVKDVTEIKEREFEQIEILNDLSHVIQNLHILRFHINRQKNEATIADNQLLQQLGYLTAENDDLNASSDSYSLSQEDASLDLKLYISKKDEKLFDEIFNGGKAPIRFIAINDLEIWYYVVVSKDDNEGYMFNINNMIDAKSRLQESDEGIQLASSSLSLVFWAVDPITENVYSIFMQPTIWDCLSADKDLEFSRFSDFVHEEDRIIFTDNYNLIKSNHVSEWIGEMRLIHAGGKFEWHRISISKLELNNITIYKNMKNVRSSSNQRKLKKDNNVKKEMYLCLCLNIHQQKKMENENREKQKLRDLLLSSGKLALWRFNDDDNSIEPMHKFDPGIQNSVVMNWTFVKKHVHPDYRELLTEKLRRAFHHDECIEMDLPLMLDEEIWVSIRGRMRNHQIVGVCIDITELRNAYNELEKEKKRAEEANKQKTVFLANMSHEIRTPMNGIFGMLDVLALKELTSEQRLLIDSIRASSFQLMRLLDDTLKLSKIEQGQFEWKPQIFDLSKLFEPICIATSSRARLSHLKLNVFIDKKFPLLVYGDSQLFSQILNNLLSNALKFTKEGSITIRLTWAESYKQAKSIVGYSNSNSDALVANDSQYDNDSYSINSEYCILEVQDTGIGISSDQQRVIFERFSQADASVQRFFGGTGLGLSLVQDIVRFLGGSVTLKSEINKGSKFTVEIPFESIYFPYSPPFNDNKVHIVLIDVDDIQLRESLIDWISYHHYKVILFNDPEIIKTYSEGNTIIEAIFVEGNAHRWPSYADVVNSLINQFIPVVSMCEAGEKPFFKYTMVKPVQYFHLVKLLNGFRYHLQNLSSSFNLSNVEEQLTKILVVEDNKANQFVMKKILETLKCSYKIAVNGKEAIQILDKEEFDIVFMDCQMPVLDGIEATRIIRRSGKLYASIPIVALTASAVEGDEQICREAGMDGYLAKPVRIQQIKDVINQFHNQ